LRRGFGWIFAVGVGLAGFLIHESERAVRMGAGRCREGISQGCARDEAVEQRTHTGELLERMHPKPEDEVGSPDTSRGESLPERAKPTPNSESM